MIEIEKKFLPSSEQLVQMLQGATSKGEIIQRDTYYDTKEYTLSLKDWWLRKRNASFELKISVQNEECGTETRYREVEDELEIRHELGIEESGEMEATLAANGFLPFGSWETRRTAYEKEGFTIDVDAVDYGAFQHDVVEIELLVSDPSMAREAADRILAFAAQYGLSTERVAGKVITYLQRERPEHYQVLREFYDRREECRKKVG